MRRSAIALLSSAMVSAALLCGAANAQEFYDHESVIVTPFDQPIMKRTLAGKVNGEANPTEFSLIRDVNFSDLNLSDPADVRALRSRIGHTARELCFELSARVPELRGYPSEERECVRKATQSAMLDALYGRG